jgi:Na+-transporting NADH:ubiquinone oxidoreductase subunit A
MSKSIELKKGFDINLVGKASKNTVQAPITATYVVKVPEFLGIIPKVSVEEGQKVKAGTPVLYSKENENLKICSPVSGEVVEVKRGEKRKLLEVKILADREVEFESFTKHSTSDIVNLKKEEALEIMLKSGVWANLIQRPYAILANPSDTPKAIFISAFDSSPLAPDYNYVFKGNENYMQVGVDILKKLTSGNVNITINADAELSQVFAGIKNATIHKVSGPHPAGNVGVQIHHIDPINKGDIAWTISPYGVIQIGKLFLEGKYDASKIIAVAGSEVKKAQYYSVISGAEAKSVLDNNINDGDIRIISGNVLTGQKITKEGHFGFYDNMLTVIPEGHYHEFLGWILPSANKLSFHRAFGLFSFLNPKGEYKVDTNIHGEERAFVQTGAFEKVVPMDILPSYLLKAIMAKDYDNMEALGIYEVAEEDFALCEFIDVSKMPVQDLIREGIELMRNS